MMEGISGLPYMATSFARGWPKISFYFPDYSEKRIRRHLITSTLDDICIKHQNIYLWRTLHTNLTLGNLSNDDGDGNSNEDVISQYEFALL